MLSIKLSDFLVAQIYCYIYLVSQESQRIFTTFHDGKPLEPLVNEKWDDYNIKVNTTLEIVLGKVCLVSTLPCNRILFVVSVDLNWTIVIINGLNVLL